VHLEIDMESPFGIKNLPDSWKDKLTTSKITSDDIKSDPKNTIKMISSYDEDLKQSIIETELLTSEEFQKLVSKVEFR
jgi:hypothetical protein